MLLNHEAGVAYAVVNDALARYDWLAKSKVRRAVENAWLGWDQRDAPPPIVHGIRCHRERISLDLCQHHEANAH